MAGWIRKPTGASSDVGPLFPTERRSLSELRQAVVEIVKEHGLRYSPQAFRLSSGELSHDYMDGKRALSKGEHLEMACRAIIELAHDEGAEFDAVGGLTLGADAYATGIALLARKQWFVVRKRAKEHGLGKRIEGAELGPGVRVLLVDDVVSTGGSILEALSAVRETGADIALAVTCVDRGEEAAPKFAELGVRYRPLITYHDLGIKPIGRVPSATG